MRPVVVLRFSSDSPIVMGYSNQAGMFQSVKDSGVHHVKLAVTDRHACDQTPQPDTVFEMGTYHFYSSKDEVVDDGKYLVLWFKSADGAGKGYKIGYDMFSSNRKA